MPPRDSHALPRLWMAVALVLTLSASSTLAAEALCPGRGGLEARLCAKYCRRSCTATPDRPSCKRLRRMFERLTGDAGISCDMSSDICSLPADPGPCDAAFLRWWHNPATGACELFVWGGCGGNGNRFETREECERRCGAGPCEFPCKSNQEWLIYPPTGERFCADTCVGVPCPQGQKCELVPVLCVRAPCPPQAQCVPAD